MQPSTKGERGMQPFEGRAGCSKVMKAHGDRETCHMKFLVPMGCGGHVKMQDSYNFWLTRIISLFLLVFQKK